MHSMHFRPIQIVPKALFKKYKIKRGFRGIFEKVNTNKDDASTWNEIFFFLK